MDNTQSLSVLWCTSSQFIREAGELYGPGLSALGLDPNQFLIVEAHKDSDVLWAIEEGLRSKTQALVIGCLDDVPLTPARRLRSCGTKICNTLFAVNKRTRTWRCSHTNTLAHHANNKQPTSVDIRKSRRRALSSFIGTPTQRI